MGSIFIINIAKGFLENKVETLVIHSLIFKSAYNGRDILKEKTTQRTEVEKD